MLYSNTATHAIQQYIYAHPFHRSLDERKELCVKGSCDFKEGFQCPDSYECLPRSVLCNGQNECADGSDESGCSKSVRSLRTQLLLQTTYMNASARMQASREGTASTGELDAWMRGADCKLPNAVPCLLSQQCISASRVCDGILDCLFGEGNTRAPLFFFSSILVFSIDARLISAFVNLVSNLSIFYSSVDFRSFHGMRNSYFHS